MACDDCGRDDGTVMYPMKPGPDGKPWEYCARCYWEGRKPFKLGMFKAATVIEDPHLADALAAASKRTAGLIDMTEERSAAKADVGDFKRTPARSRPRRA